MIITKTYKDLRPVLMEKTKRGVKVPYYLITNQDQVIFAISPGRNGLEFNKTVGDLNNFPGIQTYQCLYGYGILLMQRVDELGEAKEFKMVRLIPLKKINAPARWVVCLVNTGNNFLIVLRNSTSSEKYNPPKPIIEKRGFAYYVVEKKGEITFEQNPYYHVYPQITTE